MSTRIMKKGQVLALTIFMIIVLLASSVVFLMPIQQQLIKVRKLLYSFQALTFAESGLEIGNYYVIKSENLSGGSITTSTLSYVGSLCERKINRYNITQNWSPESNCNLAKINSQNYNLEIYSNRMTRRFLYSYFISTISLGRYKGLDRVLDFDFLP